ncbi:ATP-binding cassette domain-containing protein [Paenibacillus sp. GSMTC-2017]|uniref:ATP-binding cassette domain-containing protein n=1 Tax=Paenibacillus sp. GSMTC-2017 TaxID=2794350 RepID=UPI0018D8862E|nr:ATP-binding cassette domain-containing protein [Paenibacillus sp. GSMTC-2017]MBH5319046.1 ATP-binding cassette domain-containing protein [Paenibacillus sp. GSMTC-2017]
MSEFIEIKGASIHNLKSIDVRIPRNKLTVITGVSGSGKSSLAFDTLYEEGKRRYLLFSGTQFSSDPIPKFDSITGLSPTVAVEQRIIRQSNSRSTVGTRSKIGNLIAILYASYGQRNSSYGDKTPLAMEFFQRNSPKGMCVKCLGSGRYQEINEDAIIKMDMLIKNIFDGFLLKHRFHKSNFNKFCQMHQIEVNEKIGLLSDEQLLLFKYGCRKSGFVGAVVVFHDMQKHKSNLNARHNSADKEIMLWGVNIAPVTCPKCNGCGLGEEAIHTTISGKTITELENMYLDKLLTFFETEKDEMPGRNVIDDIIVKLRCMVDVGLFHLTLARPLPTLSGGEIQRLFLATIIIAEMDSITFIFDEPTIGLHETEKDMLITIIQNLVKRGNTVVAVEHDENVMRVADYIIDIGPDAGINGGELIFQGSFEQFMSCKNSKTAPYLSGEKTMKPKLQFKAVDNQKLLTIANANLHNLRDVFVSIPLGLMVGIAGVSGSGKSSLISGTLVPKLKQLLKGKFVHEDDDDMTSMDNDALVSGTEHIKKCIVVDQKPIGRSKSSCPATYTGITDRIRALFAKTEEALENGYSLGMFSVNSEGGCRACKGEGFTQFHIGHGNWMDVKCEMCEGTGYITEALSVTLDGKNIMDIMAMSVSEAVMFFGREGSESYDKLAADILITLESVGLGYITLGQKTPTISGGEAQRIKLAKELSKQKGAGNVYILDEPTTGLAFSDRDRLITLMQQLVDDGNTVIVTEHDPLVLTRCDYLIEMGPGGGSNGGYIIAEGTPKELIANKQSIIGNHLEKVKR